MIVRLFFAIVAKNQTMQLKIALCIRLPGKE
jgi:hypothetical protein